VADALVAALSKAGNPSAPLAPKVALEGLARAD
jgi:hypothetical protein